MKLRFMAERWAPRPLWIVNAALLLVVASQPGWAQDSTVSITDRPSLPRELAVEALERYNRSAALRATGSLSVPADKTVAGDVAVLHGPLTIAGHVQGSVVVINGDLVLAPGARVAGDILVVGGVIDGERGATVGGAVTRNPLPLRYVRRDDQLVLDEDTRASTFIRSVRRSSSRIRLTAGGYNRVEGLPVIAGPVFRRRTDWGTIRAEALGILRSAGDFAWSSANVGHDARLEVRFGDRSGIALGGQAYDVVDGFENWHLKGSEVALASFFFHRDFRDYFNRHGARAYATLEMGPHAEFELGYARERWGGRGVADPFTILHDSDPWRANPLADEGVFRIAKAILTFDTRNDIRDPWTGWFLNADFEQGASDAVRLAPLTPMARSSTPGSVEPLKYARLFLDFRRYNRASPDGQLNFRLVLGSSFGKDPLPVQRRLSLGGPGTLPGFDFRRRTDGDDVLTCTEDLSEVDPARVLPEGRPAQCERIALAQVEYRGDLRIGIGGGPSSNDRNDDRWHNFKIQHAGQWVVFADAGRGWLVGPGRVGQIQYRAGQLPALRTFHTDIGAGLDFDVIGFFVAKSTSHPDQPTNFFVRLRHRF
ncbi:MAG TPA: hypothetical protein VMM77_11795 [Gemmatimonadaceae bacterium]|nr:hypothetical protein [Gemmatimonadaceae bacterium]